MPQDRANRWLGTKDAAAHLGVAESTLWRLVDEGHIPAYRPARNFQFRESDLDAYLEQVRVKPGEVTSKRADVANRRRTPKPKD